MAVFYNSQANKSFTWKQSWSSLPYYSVILDASITATQTTFPWKWLQFLKDTMHVTQLCHVPDLSHLLSDEVTWSCGEFKSWMSVANCSFQPNRKFHTTMAYLRLNGSEWFLKGSPGWWNYGLSCLIMDDMVQCSCMNFKCEITNVNMRNEFKVAKCVNVEYARSTFHGIFRSFQSYNSYFKREFLCAFKLIPLLSLNIKKYKIDFN